MALSHQKPKPVIFGIFEVNPAKLCQYFSFPVHFCVKNP